LVTNWNIKQLHFPMKWGSLTGRYIRSILLTYHIFHLLCPVFMDFLWSFYRFRAVYTNKSNIYMITLVYVLEKYLYIFFVYNLQIAEVANRKPNIIIHRISWYIIQLLLVKIIVIHIFKCKFLIINISTYNFSFYLWNFLGFRWLTIQCSYSVYYYERTNVIMCKYLWEWNTIWK